MVVQWVTWSILCQHEFEGFGPKVGVVFLRMRERLTWTRQMWAELESLGLRMSIERVDEESRTAMATINIGGFRVYNRQLCIQNSSIRQAGTLA